MTGSSLIEEDVAKIARGIGASADKLSGKTILVSGGAGFLGKYFVGVFGYLNRQTLRKPCRVISLDNYMTGSQDAAFDFADPQYVLQVRADVTQPLPVRENIHYMIHAAGLASPVYYMRYPLETIESAVTGVKNMLELSRRNPLEGFLLFSSSEIYGDPDPRSVPTPETYHGNVSPVGPRACYDESKRLAETIATIYFQKHGIPVKITRPFNVFGPGMKHDDYRVLPMFAYRALNGLTLPVHGDGRQTRTFCYITDAVVGFLKCLLVGQPGETYNIGNDKNEISICDLARLVTEVVGQGASFELAEYPSTYPAGEPQRRCPDLTKARNKLGYFPEVTLQAGTTRFIDWCRQAKSYRSV